MICFVYILESTSGATYVGATIDVEHRLRQHNGEIKGGAKATSIKCKKGEIWRRVCYVKHFPSWISALQFEWRLKQLSRRLFTTTSSPLLRRLKALHQLLSLDKPTTKSMTYNEWEIYPEIVWSNEKDEELFTQAN